ncbi:MAG: DUF5686 and carboxypeptidase regulatory-like domain-containing protein [Bacteroidetes bacterium]|nr:DUF5686 and carboxypeptidase regulatory-like domain-containing protein [Bacteroidota bacterium]
MCKIVLTFLAFLLICNLVIAQSVIEGVVIDKQTNKPIPAATIRIEGSNKGTICGNDGSFRLPKGYFFNKSDVRITSIGYHTKIVSLDLREDKVTIYLEQNPVELNAAVVVGEIEVNEIIRRAIKKKDENRKKYNTMQGLLYSKFTLDMSKFSQGTLGMDANKTYKTKVIVKPINLETFYVSRKHYDDDSTEITVNTNTEFKVDVNGKKISNDTLITSKHRKDKNKTYKTKVTVLPINEDTFYLATRSRGQDSSELTVYTNKEFEIDVNGQKVSSDTLIISKHKGAFGADFLEGMIYETFSEKYVDLEKGLDKTIIVNRRQTANVPKQLNTMVLEQFVDFSQDEIEFIDAKIVTPLHKNALTHYKFKLLERKLFEDKYVYVIEVIPNTKVYPCFEGTISIIEGTYQLIEAKLKPSPHTKIHLIDNIEWLEKFENVGNDIWFPTYMENKATLKMKVFPGIPQIEIDWTTTSIFSDVILDQPLPDYVYNDSIIYVDDIPTNFYKSNKMYDSDGNIIQNIDIHPEADSTKEEYWEDNSLIILTEKEQEMYVKIDTAAKELGAEEIYSKMNFDSIMANSTSMYSMSKNKFSFNWFPMYRYNRVEDYLGGIMADVSIPYTNISGAGGYSTGQYRWFGNAKLELGNNFGNKLKIGSLFSFSKMMPIISKKPSFFISAEIFSNVRSFGSSFANTDPDIDMLGSGVLDMWIAKKDYYDYYNTDGWNTQLNFNYKKLKLNAIYENRRDFVLNNSTYKGYWSSTDFSKFRVNPHCETGEFQIIKLSSTFGRDITSMSESFQYKFNLNYLYGIRASDKSNFSQVYGTAAIQFPIFETGYGNILMLLSAAGGFSDNNTPVQNLFVIEQTSFISNLFTPTDNTFITAYENYLGGTEFYSYSARLNLRDWWWRLLRLPKIKGRGLELSFAGIAGKFFNKGTTELSNLYHSTEKDYYTEAGFRIGRIPIPKTDFIYWSWETRFGIGKYAKGSYGFLLNFQFPF